MANITDVKLPDNSQYDLKDNVSGYAKKVAGATTDDLASLTATGDLADSGKKLSDLVLKADVKDVLNSTSTTDPLSAKQGKVLADNLAANEKSGAKNLIPYPFYETTKTDNGITFTDNGDGSITVSGTASANASFFITINSNNEKRLDYDYPLAFTGTPSNSYGIFSYVDLYDSNNQFYQEITDSGAGGTLPTGYYPYSIGISVPSGANISTPIVIKLMLRDARIIDPTFAPFAETNLQLTQNKAERADLATLNLTGSTNSTGAQIDAGTFFYLNGQLCKAMQNIAANATFTLNTNYEEVTVGGDLKKITDTVNYHNSFIPIQQYIQAQSSIMYSLSRGIYIVSVWQGGSVNDFSGLWIAYISNYTGGCSVAPLVTPTIPDIVLSVSANALTITNNNTTYSFDTSVMLINGYM